MLAVRSFALFTLERIRCVLLALATIVILKLAAITFLAPLANLGLVEPGPSQAAQAQAAHR